MIIINIVQLEEMKVWIRDKNNLGEPGGGGGGHL